MLDKEPTSFDRRMGWFKGGYDDDFLRACGIAQIESHSHSECSSGLRMIRDLAESKGLRIPEQLTVTRSTAKQFFLRSPDGPGGKYLLVDWALYFIESPEIPRAEYVKGHCADSAESEFIRKLIDAQDRR
jgi:hypothetical protein